MNKTAGVGVAILIIALGAVWYFYSYSKSNEDTPTSESTVSESTGTSGMRAEENMVVVLEQQPGEEVRGMVYLAAPGYLVIHEDDNGQPGRILGASALLSAGESSDIRIRLSRPMQDGETLHAMLHFEKGGNTAFSAIEDTPVPSRLGGPIGGWFEVSSGASLDTPVSI